MEFWSKPEEIPKKPGAYLLAVQLSRPLKLTLTNRPPASLAAGCYLYCGSAKGPGGLRARIGRHMRRGKVIRWHIDHLTEAGRVLGAWARIGGDECQMVAALSRLPMPVEGFGNSDCRNCRSHLLRWPGKPAAALQDSIDWSALTHKRLVGPRT
jgi:Uri superfamily endonuclease